MPPAVWPTGISDERGPVNLTIPTSVATLTVERTLDHSPSAHQLVVSFPTPQRVLPGGAQGDVQGYLVPVLTAGERISILWQIVPYVVLTVGEILVSVTGLEFAYTQAPLTMKSVIQSFWNLTTAAANLAVALASALAFFTGTALFFYYAGFAYLAAIGLALVGRRYKVVEWYQRAPVPQQPQRAPALGAEPA